MTIEDDVLEALSEALENVWSLLTKEQIAALDEETVATCKKNHEWTSH